MQRDFGSIPESPHVQTLSALNEKVKLLSFIIAAVQDSNASKWRTTVLKCMSVRRGVKLERNKTYIRVPLLSSVDVSECLLPLAEQNQLRTQSAFARNEHIFSPDTLQ